MPSTRPVNTGVKTVAEPSAAVTTGTTKRCTYMLASRCQEMILGKRTRSGADRDPVDLLGEGTGSGRRGIGTRGVLPSLEQERACGRRAGLVPDRASYPRVRVGNIGLIAAHDRDDGRQARCDGIARGSGGRLPARQFVARRDGGRGRA